MLVAPLLLASLSPAPQSFQNEIQAAIPERVASYVDFADINQDGVLDLIATRTLGSARGLWVEGRAGGSFLKTRFTTAPAPMPGGSARRTIAGDIDGDGDPDVLTFGFNAAATPELGWVENTSAGTFLNYTTIAILPTGFGIRIFGDLVDLDADGDLDVVLGREQRRPSWIENQGSGVFGPPVELAALGQPMQEMLVRDFDGDGLLDVVWGARSNGGIGWIRNLGGGQFAPAAPLGTLTDPTALDVADLDGDGLLDLIVRDQSAGIDLFWVRQIGAGAMEPPASLFASASTRKLTTGDFDDDGDIDIVTASAFGPLNLYRNTGSAAFRAPEDVGQQFAGAAEEFVYAADVNGDGKQDIVFNQDDLIWYENTGASGPGPARTITRVLDRGTLVDLTGDGTLDLIRPNFYAETIELLPFLDEGQLGDPVTLITGADNVSRVEAADADGDGDKDILASGGTSGFAGARVTLHRRTSAGFTSVQSLMPNVTNFGEASAEWNDMDGDGDPDIAILFPVSFQPEDLSFVWLRGNGTGAFAATAAVPLPTLDEILGFVDLDGDGRTDIVGVINAPRRVAWRQGLPDDSFAAPVVTPATRARDASIVDLDGDGLLDILFIDAATDELRTCRQTAQGSFAASEFAYALPTQSTTVRTGDWDLDGDPDPVVTVIVQGQFQTSQTLVLNNLGAGNYALAQTLESDSEARPITGVDLDGDLDIDLVKFVFHGPSFVLNGMRFGDAYCASGAPNSTGVQARTSAEGSPTVALNDVTLLASDLPMNAFGYFLLGDATNAVVPPNSQGTLCIGGSIGRLNRGPNEIFQASPDGSASVTLDITNLPSATGAGAVLPGDTRYFQAWHRDANPAVTSNFSTGLAIRFR